MISDLLKASPLWSHLGLSLAHFLWEGAAIAMLLAVGLFLLRKRSPGIRHALCLFALVAMTACPAVTLWFVESNPPAILTWIDARAEGQPVASSESRPPISAQPPSSDTHALFRSQAAEETAIDIAPEATLEPAADAPALHSTTRKATEAHAGVAPPALKRHGARLAWGFSLAAFTWSGCVAFLVMRFLYAWTRLLRLRSSTEALPSTVQTIADRLLARMDLRRLIPIRVSRAIAEPIAFGLLRPMVLLPASLLTQCPMELLEAMIAHELAHIRRYDLWINLFQRAVETLLFYHPAVWWVSSRMRLERELCCDDLAIHSTGKRADYADALVELSRTLHGWSTPMLTAGMFTSRMSLATRIRRVLQLPATRHDPNAGRYWMTAPITLALAGSLVLAAAFHSSVADQPSAAGPAAQPAGAVATGIPATMPSASSGIYRCDEPSCKFGEVWSGEDVEHEFVIHNDGTTPLEIPEAQPSCGCTTADWSKLIPPGGQTKVRATIRTKGLFPTEITKTIKLKTSDPKNRNPILQLSGKVKARVLIEPAVIIFGKIEELTPLTKTVTLTNNMPGPLTLELVPSPGSQPFSASLKVIEAGKQFALTVTADKARLREGLNYGQVGLKTTPGGAADLFVPINAVRMNPLPATLPASRPAGPSADCWNLPSHLSPKESEANRQFDGALAKWKEVFGAIQLGDKSGIDLSNDETLIDLNQALFERGYWLMRRKNQVTLCTVSEWYRGIPAEHKFAAEEPFRRADLPLWEVASIEYRPTRQIQVIDLMEFLKSRGKGINLLVAQPAEQRFVFSGFALHLSTFLDALRKLDAGLAVEPRPAAPKRVFIRSMMDGVIVNVPVTPGQHVKKGDLLVQLDDAEARLEVQAAEARLQLARSKYEWGRQSRAGGVISEQERLDTETQLKLAQVELQKWVLKIDRSRIVSPADGTVGVQVDMFFDFGWAGKAIKAGESLFDFQPDAPVDARK